MVLYLAIVQKGDKTKLYLNKKQQFGALIRRIRKKQHMTQEEIGDGIYNVALISRIERGKFLPNKLIRDRLLERLGESGYDYETYIEAEDYKQWQLQNVLMYTLDAMELDKAKQLLQQYEERYKEKNTISKQFYFVMLLQWLELTDATKEECSCMLEQAVKLTISQIKTKPISSLILSVSELNLVLEYITYQNANDLYENYIELFWYIEQERFDLESRALFYSKLAFYFCEYQWKKLKSSEDNIEIIAIAKEMLQICTKGIEHIRNHKKIYFAWELLQMKQKVIEVLLEKEEGISQQQIDSYKKEQEEAKDFFEVLDGLYEKYHIKKETNHYTIFYRKQEVYCINDVIRARRNMFQVSLATLEKEKICSVKTIRRIEKSDFSIQKEVVQQLFHRFHLSMELQRSFIITDSQEAIWLEQNYRVVANQREYAKAREMIKRLKEMISMEEEINRQYIEYEELHIAYKMEEISKEEFIQCAITVLEYTMPLHHVLKSIEDSKGVNKNQEQYFTNMELTILHNIAQELEKEEKEQYFFILQKYLENLEQQMTLPAIFGMYGFIMSTISSYMGNVGQFEKSSEINIKIIEYSLKLRHLEYVEDNLYDLMWNEEKRKGLPEKENLERLSCMKDCLVIDIYNRNKWNENWMRTRLNDILS